MTTTTVSTPAKTLGNSVLSSLTEGNYVPAIKLPVPPKPARNTEMKRCVIGIRRAREKAAASHAQDEPTVWFPSMATMAAVLSEDNQSLLRLIRDKRPRSLTELAQLTGRLVPNLSRTLRTMEGYGLVELRKHVREIQPIALATSFKLLID